MNNLIFVLTCIISLNLNAQTISGNFSFSPEPYNTKFLDKSFHFFFYSLDFVPNKDNPESKRNTVYILQIGKNYSKFTEYNNLKRDSLNKNFSSLKTVGAKEANELSQFKVQSKKTLIKDINNKTNLIQDVIGYTYQYEDKQPVLKWNLINESKEILGFKSKKATTHYSGRNYTAWYSAAIPINNGPYIFQGLPGLILSLSSDDGEYVFNIIGSQKKEDDIYLRINDKIINTTRKKFQMLEKSYFDNPGFFHGKSYNSDGSEMITKQKAMLYNPLELD